uniref:class I SAM-dependent methyltransferase n=1 Tax=Roseivirga sp. TaxID=1964215 RepID=UPI004047C63E
MANIVLPPGNILQNLYIKERIQRNGWKSFFEIGSGNGYLSKLMLDAGLEGEGCDMNESACSNNRKINKNYINVGRYKVEHGDFFNIETHRTYDVVFACMVIEHLDLETRFQFITKMKSMLNPEGTVLLMVPSSKKHWGIEDEIAGHFLRYDRNDLTDLSKEVNLSISHLAGLTYPISDFLFGVSNFLIKKNESKVLEMSQIDRTLYTCNRQVPFKTTFPNWLGIFLNEYFLYPLHWLQKRFKENKNALVLYAELK